MAARCIEPCFLRMHARRWPGSSIHASQRFQPVTIKGVALTQHVATVSVGICIATVISFGITDRADAAGKKACELLSSAEITQQIGFQVDAGTAKPTRDYDRCLWKGSGLIQVDLILENAQLAQTMLQDYTQHTKEVDWEPVSGVGSKAVVVRLEPGYTIHVADGPGGFQLIVVTRDAKPQVIALAKLIESRR